MIYAGGKQKVLFQNNKKNSICLVSILEINYQSIESYEGYIGCTHYLKI